MTKRNKSTVEDTSSDMPTKVKTRKFFAPTTGMTVEASDSVEAALLATKPKKDEEVGDDII